MKKNAKILLCTGLAALTMLTFAACGKDADTADPISGEPTSAGTSLICPLDGTALKSEADHGDYVFMVSIDNGAKSEPQSGIGKADLLIEVPVEGGINRFMAFFYHSTPDTIGPVRSARHYMYDIVNGYNGIMAHCGGSAPAYEVIDSGKVKDIDEMGCSSTFWRTKDRKAPHNLYTSYANLAAKAADRSYATVPVSSCPSFDFMTADDVAALTLGGSNELTIPSTYKEVTYRWDGENKNYQRYSAGNLHTDAIDNSTVTADNVVVLYQPYVVMEDGVLLDMTMTGGEGLVLQYGNAIKINWTLSDGKGFAFTDAATGEAVKLIPGKTIIQIAGTDQKANYTVTSDEGATE